VPSGLGLAHLRASNTASNYMKKLLLIISVLFLFSFLTQDAYGGAWTLPKYGVWSEMYLKWYWSKHDFNYKGHKKRKQNGARSWGWNMEPKLEWGLTDWITLLGSIEYKESRYKEYGRPPAWGDYDKKNNGMSFVKCGGRVRFLEDPVVISTQIKAFIYPGGYDKGRAPSIGYGEDALEIRALIGKEFYLPFTFKNEFKLRCYFGAESGYRFKNRNVSNDIPFFLEGGIWIFDWLMIKAEIDGYKAHEGTGEHETDYAIWRVGPSFQFLGGDPISHEGKQFNVEVQYGQTFWGKNTSCDQEITLKLQTQF